MLGRTTTAALADAMTLSSHTVHTMVAIVFRKLQVRDRTQIVNHAWRHGTLEGNRWVSNHQRG
jgi:DNA-binding NarL/FixJ family response regulator